MELKYYIYLLLASLFLLFIFHKFINGYLKNYKEWNSMDVENKLLNTDDDKNVKKSKPKIKSSASSSMPVLMPLPMPMPVLIPISLFFCFILCYQYVILCFIYYNIIKLNYICGHYYCNSLISL